MRATTLFRKASIPCAGVALGFAALGNLLQTYSEALHSICGIVSLAFIVLLGGKLLCDRSYFRKAMDDPIQASVSGTLPMAFMLLSTYIAAVAYGFALFIWFAAICAHIALIIWFTKRYFLEGFALKRVFASYFIVYVGIVVASVSAPVYGMQTLGNVAFWFGFICFIWLFVLVSWRYVKIPEPTQASRPIFCIYAAPASLCVAGYVRSGEPSSLQAALVLLALASVIYMVVLLRLPSLLRLPFYPSYASFTFPFVISALAMKQTGAMALKAGATMDWISVVANVETVIATLLCLYVLVRFCGKLFGAPEVSKEQGSPDTNMESSR
jgi:exfoliative toxin A/B